LPAVILEKLATFVIEVVYPPGAVIVADGSPGASLYVVEVRASVPNRSRIIFLVVKLFNGP
jgi:hypothetical protein